MSALQMIVTNAGRAKIAAAIAASTTVTISQVGISATAITASVTTSNLTGEIKRLTPSGEVAAADTIHIVARDETTDAYSVKSLALYLSDGTLFASYGQSGDIINKTAASLMLLQIDTIFADITASTITFGNANFLNPPATDTLQGVVELATPAEVLTGTDSTRAVTPAGAAGAFVKRAGDTMTGALGTTGFRVTGSGSFFATGAGTELLYGAGVGSLQAYDRGTSAYKPLSLYGTTISLLPQSGGSLVITGNGSVSGTWSILGSTAWCAANDGSGSGLDADMLDGLQGSAFAQLSGATFTGAVAFQGTEYPRLAIAKSGTGTWYVGGGGSVGDNGFAIRLNSNTPALYFDPAAAATFANSIGAAGNIQSSTQVRAGLTGSAGSSRIVAGDATHTGLVDFLNTAGTQVGSIQQTIGGDIVYSNFGTGGHLFNGDYLTVRNSSQGGVSLARGTASLTGRIILTDTSGGSSAYIGGQTIGQATALSNSAGHAFSGGALTLNGSTVWHAGNDGAGSGVDADLLDGQQGSFYAPVVGPAFSGGVAVGGDLTAHNNIVMDNAAPQIILGTAARLGRGSAGALCLYNDTSGNERLRMGNDGSISILGPRNLVGDAQGTGSLRVVAATAGGRAVSINDDQDYTAVQLNRISGSSVNMVGSITCTETGASFNNLSDYRFKTDVVPLEGALDRINALKVYEYTVHGAKRRSRGVIAHEAAGVVPEAVHGEKDAVDEAGTAIPQGVDYSKFVPDLIAANQELFARLTAAEAEIQKLKARRGPRAPVTE